MKTIIKESELKYIIENSVKNILNEWYDRNEFRDYSSYVFDNDETLTYLEKLVLNFTNKSINVSSDNEDIDWGEFANGIAILCDMAKEKVEYDKYNIKQIYQKHVNNGTEDEFWVNPDYYHYEYISNYVGEYAATEKWDKYMPTPEQVKQMTNYFVEWLKRQTEYEIREYTQNKWKDYEIINDYLSKNV